MEEVVLYGLPPSTYVRTVLMTLEEKAVPYRLEQPDFRSADYKSLHPFNRIPAFRHGDFKLFETLAIAVYIDEIFDGPRLQPEKASGKALMLQWISATNDYLYDSILRACIAERFIKPMQGQAPDEEAIARAKPTLAAHLDILDRALSSTPYLAGDTVSLADLFLAPIVFYLSNTPEGRELLPARSAVQGWHEKIAASESYSKVNTPIW